MAKYINKNGFTRHWDDVAKSPYLWNPTSRTFISYADPESLKNRVDYVKSKHLAGVMFWNISTIYSKKARLLNALANDLN